MEKLKWYFIGKNDKVSKEDKDLRSVVKKLYKVCKKNNMQYSDVYIMSSQGNTTLNIRGKRGEEVVVNSYAFIRKEILLLLSMVVIAVIQFILWS